MKAKDVEPKVLRLLETIPETRKDDWLLLKHYYSEIIDVKLFSFATVCDYHNEFELPSFESIRRCRQKIQSKRPDLVDPGTAKKRHKLIDEYKEYAKI